MLYPLPEQDNLNWDGFTNPFRYTPHPLVKRAASEVMSRLESWRQMSSESAEHKLELSFAEGKMLGVLICLDSSSRALCYLAAFSGTVQGPDGRVTSTVEGFVPPIIDLTDLKGYFKTEEEKISKINREIAAMSASDKLSELKDAYNNLSTQRNSELNTLQAQMQCSKKRREEIRSKTTDPNILNDLIKESQFQKAELKRLKDKWKVLLESLSLEISHFENSIASLKAKRAKMSDELQRWIFDNSIVHNALGQTNNIWNLFQDAGLIPPGGTGDCAGPKLLEYAFRNGLQPLAMGEFWYGKSPETAVRTHGHFYPSCTSKCGPLLCYMTKGLKVESDAKSALFFPVIIYEDESIIVAEKPSGMPSVPGLDGRHSLEEWLNALTTLSKQDTNPQQSKKITAVHRLDMDTSGVMVFAKTRHVEINLKKQFEEHSVRKTYFARLTSATKDQRDVYSSIAAPGDQVVETVLPLWPQREGPAAQRWEGLFLQSDSQGLIRGKVDLPLSADYDERPRQKVDFKQGKPAHTEYKIIKDNPDGTIDILLYPHTGRTHQLRVHCAHTLGLGCPIVGDLLYGAHTCLPTEATLANTGHSAERLPERLCLHALSITFRHPSTDAELTFTSKELCW